METTLRQIGRAIVHAINRVLDAKIKIPKIRFRTFLLIVIIFFIFVVSFAIFYDELDDTTGIDEFRKWLNEEPTAEDWLNDEFRPWLESPEGKDWLKKNE